MSSIDHGTPRPSALGFGVGALVVLGGFGALYGWRKHHVLVGGVIGGIGVLVFLLALAAPSVALMLRAGWMRFAGVLGWVNSRILLGAIFFLVLTPIALVRRLVGSDPLDVRWRPAKRETYWRNHEAQDSKHYEHQS